MNAVQSHCKELDRCNQRGGRMLSVVDLIDAGTLDIDTAAYLATVISRGGSFLVGAMPGGAGKTTVMAALLNFLPRDVAIVPAASAKVLRLATKPNAPRTCYLCHEIGSGSYYAYLWGRDARDFFALKNCGHIVATNLHADTFQQTHDQLCGDNNVDEADLRRVDLMLFIELAGRGRRTLRRIATVWESDGSSPHRMIFRSSADGLRPTDTPRLSKTEVETFKLLLHDLRRDNIRKIQDVRSRVMDFLDS